MLIYAHYCLTLLSLAVVSHFMVCQRGAQLLAVKLPQHLAALRNLLAVKYLNMYIPADAQAAAVSDVQVCL